MLGLVLTTIAGSLPGCVSRPAHAGGESLAGVGAGEAPEDFWLSLTLVGQQTQIPKGQTPEQAAAHRPARYVVEGDRVLRVGTGPVVSDEQFPPALRQLSGDQVQQLYRQMQVGGLLRKDHPAIVSSAPRQAILPTEQRVILSYRADGARRTLVVDPAADEQLAKPLFALSGRLANMAWLSGSGVPEAAEASGASRTP